jgi:hypothetical protein
MCCCHSKDGQCLEAGPMLWSKEKKIRVLQEKLEGLKEKKQEIETLIQELKNE